MEKLKVLAEAVQLQWGHAEDRVAEKRRMAAELLRGISGRDASQVVQIAAQAHEHEAFAAGYEQAAKELLGLFQAILEN